jgi:hypothetical protein
MGKLRIATIRDEFLRAFQPLECLVEEAEFLGQTRLILSISHAHKVVLQVQSIPIQKIAEPRRFAVFVKEARNRLEASGFWLDDWTPPSERMAKLSNSRRDL